MSDHELEVGVTVTWTEYRDQWSGRSSYKHGTLTRIGAKSVTVVPEGSEVAKVLRRDRRGQMPCRYESPAEIAERKWLARQPKGEVVGGIWYGVEARLSLSIRRTDTADRFDAAIADIAALRDWLAERPVTP